MGSVALKRPSVFQCYAIPERIGNDVYYPDWVNRKRRLRGPAGTGFGMEDMVEGGIVPMVVGAQERFTSEQVEDGGPQ